MKEGKLKVGAKSTGRPSVVVPCSLAENVEDMTKLAHGDVGVVVRCFNRGFRIESQERSGAREAFKEGQTPEQIAAIVAAYDPTQVAERAKGPKPPKEIKLKAGKKSYTPDEIAELLKSAGVKANLTVAQ